MANKYLEHLKESSSVFYIYQRGLEIYGIPNSPKEYLVIINSSYKVPREFNEFKLPAPYMNIKYKVKYDNSIFVFMDIKEWFRDIIRGNVNCWECACLNKKFIDKEYVKLLISTNPYNLRVDCLKYYKDSLDLYKKFQDLGKTDKAIEILWRILNRVVLTNQIIENHKIVRFKDCAEMYSTIANSEDKLATFTELTKPHLDKLYKLTDGIVKKVIQDKVIQKK